jgi:uncharacterized protein
MITGYAAVFYRKDDPGTQFGLWAGCVERVAPTAFNNVIAEAQDVRALFDHREDQILGRTKSGTCRLSVDAVGLRYEIDPLMVGDKIDDETAALIARIERGDIDGSSFAFRVRSNGATWTTEKYGDAGVEIEVRTLTDVDVFDVGPTAFPAYKSTTAGLRSDNAEALKAERTAMKTKPVTPRDVVKATARVIEISSALS